MIVSTDQPLVNFSHMFPTKPLAGPCSAQLALRALCEASVEFRFCSVKPANLEADDVEDYQL